MGLFGSSGCGGHHFDDEVIDSKTEATVKKGFMYNRLFLKDVKKVVCDHEGCEETTTKTSEIGHIWLGDAYNIVRDGPISFSISELESKILSEKDYAEENDRIDELDEALEALETIKEALT